jgi:hypothetical protein
MYGRNYKVYDKFDFEIKSMKFLLTRSGKQVLNFLDVDIKFCSIGNVCICVCTCISTLMTILYTYPASQFRKSNRSLSVQTLSQLQIEIEMWLFILGCLVPSKSRSTHGLYAWDYESSQTQMEVPVRSNSSVLILLESFFPHCFLFFFIKYYVSLPFLSAALHLLF